MKSETIEMASHFCAGMSFGRRCVTGAAAAGQSAPVACGVFRVLHPPPLRNHSLDGAHSSFTRTKLIRLVRLLKNGILSEA
jgi:hypothetical protein